MNPTTSRLKYIDAMRGLAILLVVFSHVTNTYATMPISNKSFAGVYYMMTMFRMPLFFFVSGFFAYRAAARWDGTMVRRVMTKKVQAQVIGLGVFVLLFGALMKNWHFDFIWKSNPYWFTESLFEMFCLYLLFALLERRTGWKWPLHALMCIAILSPFIFNYFTEGVKLPRWVTGLQTWHTLNYLPYFMLGIFARRNEEGLWTIIDNKWLKAVTVVGFFSLVLFYGCRHRYSVEWDLVMTGMRLSGLMTILIAFRTYRDYFESGSRLSRAMCFAGSRTLDVYYLHYFFIPDLSFLKNTLSAGQGNSIVGMLAIGITASILVISVCLLVSAVIRTSPVLSEWLFGITAKRGASPTLSTAVTAEAG